MTFGTTLVLLTEGQASEAWEPPNRVMLLLPPQYKTASHYSLRSAFLYSPSTASPSHSLSLLVFKNIDKTNSNHYP